MSQSSSNSQPSRDVRPVPQVGARAPSSPKLSLPNGRLTLVVFLRYCGDPFAEKNFKNLAAISEEHPDIQCYAVSQSSEQDTEAWIPQVGGTWDVQVIVDPSLELFAQWGLGTSTVWHAYNPVVLWSTFQLGKNEGIWNKGGKSGDLWQTGGAFAVDRFGSVCWTHVSASANDTINFDEALEKLLGK